MTAPANCIGLTPVAATATAVLLLHAALLSCARSDQAPAYCRGGVNRAEMRNFHIQPIPQEAINVRGE